MDPPIFTSYLFPFASNPNIQNKTSQALTGLWTTLEGQVDEMMLVFTGARNKLMLYLCQQ